MENLPEFIETHKPEEADDFDGDVSLPSPKSSIKAIQNEFSSLILLICLYSVQGMTLSFYESSLEIILTSQGAKYTELGVFSLIMVPFSFKIFFAPFLDIYYFKKFGKRKTYIVPILYILCGFTLALSFFIDSWVQNFRDNMTILVLSGMGLLFLCGLQDVANDAWVLTLISPENLIYGSLAQYVGRILGTLFGFYFLIPLNSVDFCNEYIFEIPRSTPLVKLQYFMILVAACELALAFYIHLLKREQNPVKQEYKTLLDIVKLFKGMYSNKNIRLYVLFLLTLPVTLIVVKESATVTLIREGMRKDHLSNMGLICLPLAFITCLIATRKMHQNPKNLRMMINAVIVLMITNVVVVYIFTNFDKDTNYKSTWIMLLIIRIIDVPAAAIRTLFHNNFVQRIADPEIAGSYITTLHAISNFSWAGYTFVTLFLLDRVNLFILLAITWSIGIVWLATFGRYVTNTLDSKPASEFDVRSVQIKDNLQYSDIPDEEVVAIKESV